MLNLVLTHLCGLNEVDSIGGTQYLLTFNDSSLIRVIFYVIKKKSEAASRFTLFQKFVNRQNGCQIYVVPFDMSDEFLFE